MVKLEIPKGRAVKLDLVGTDLIGAKHDLVFGLTQFIEKFGVEVKGQTLILYKYLRKDMTSPYQGLKYEIGKIYKMDIKDCDENIFNNCGAGFNVATKEWCLKDSKHREGEWKFVQAAVHWKDVISVPLYTDGKIRCRKMKILADVTDGEDK